MSHDQWHHGTCLRYLGLSEDDMRYSTVYGHDLENGWVSGQR